MPGRSPISTRRQLNILKIRARRDVKNAVETALALGIRPFDIFNLVREVVVVAPHVPNDEVIKEEEAKF